MIKRKISFIVAYFKNNIHKDNLTFTFYLTCILFAIVFITFTFISSKKEPIPLTESEIDYYITQAQLAYHEGHICLDKNVEFIDNHDGSFDVYGYNQPKQKQKLTVTFLEGGEVDINTYYSYYFLADGLITTIGICIMSFVVCISLTFAIILILIALLEFKNFIKSKLSKK